MEQIVHIYNNKKSCANPMNSRAVSYGFYQGSRNCIYKYMFFDLSN